MAEKERIIKEKLEHSGYFDFKGFYKYAHSWLEDEGYGVVEDKYSEKVSGNSREITIEWDASKKLSDYFQIEMEVVIEISDLTDVEVEIDNKRKKMNKGKVSVEIKATLIKDPESKWDSSNFYRFLRDVYNKFIIPSRVDKISGMVAEDTITLKEELKAFLELSARR